MVISRGLKQAYDAQDLAFATLCEYRAAIAPNGTPRKLSREEAETLANLVNAFLACQAQIRLHRGLSGLRVAGARAARRATNKTARRRAQELLERGPVEPILTKVCRRAACQ